jgi:hypothetical protein
MKIKKVYNELSDPKHPVATAMERQKLVKEVRITEGLDNMPNNDHKKSNQSQIILYTTPDGDIKIDTILQDETLWLTQSAMAELFDIKIPAVSKHLKNIFESGELDEKVVVSI